MVSGPRCPHRDPRLPLEEVQHILLAFGLGARIARLPRTDPVRRVIRGDFAFGETARLKHR